MAAFIASSTRLVKTIEGVRENGAPPAALAPLRSVVAAVAPRPEVADKIRACVDDQGGFRDNASPELRRARSQRSAAEAKLRRALQSGNGSVTTHQGRMVLAVTPPAPPGSLVGGVAAGGALVLVEPPSVVERQLAQTIAAEETAIDAIRRKLTYDVAEAATDLFAARDGGAPTSSPPGEARRPSTRPTEVCRPTDRALIEGSACPAREEGEGDGEDGAERGGPPRNAEMAASFPTLTGGRADATRRRTRVARRGREPTRRRTEGAPRGAGGSAPARAAAQATRAEGPRRAAAKRRRRSVPAGRPRGGRTIYCSAAFVAGIDSGSETPLLRAGAVVRGQVPVDVFVPLSARSVGSRPEHGR